MEYFLENLRVFNTPYVEIVMEIFTNNGYIIPIEKILSKMKLNAVQTSLLILETK